jgi:hypothetical protein
VAAAVGPRTFVKAATTLENASLSPAVVAAKTPPEALKVAQAVDYAARRAQMAQTGAKATAESRAGKAAEAVINVAEVAAAKAVQTTARTVQVEGGTTAGSALAAKPVELVRKIRAAAVAADITVVAAVVAAAECAAGPTRKRRLAAAAVGVRLTSRKARRASRTRLARLRRGTARLSFLGIAAK